MFTCCYLASVQPFDNPWLNRLEIMNEVFVLYSIYWLYFFANLIAQPHVQYKAA